MTFVRISRIIIAVIRAYNERDVIRLQPAARLLFSRFRVFCATSHFCHPRTRGKQAARVDCRSVVALTRIGCACDGLISLRGNCTTEMRSRICKSCELARAWHAVIMYRSRNSRGQKSWESQRASPSCIRILKRISIIIHKKYLDRYIRIKCRERDCKGCRWKIENVLKNFVSIALVALRTCRDE